MRNPFRRAGRARDQRRAEQHLSTTRIADATERARIVAQKDYNLNGTVPRSANQYWAQASRFNPSSYDPDRWLAAAKAAGFTYAVFTTRHHEGFAMLTRLTRAPRVIFVTAFDEYAMRAFEFGAADYLLKPVDPTRLAVALARVAQGTDDPPEDGPGGPLPASQQVFVREGDRCWLVRLSDVVLFVGP